MLRSRRITCVAWALCAVGTMVTGTPAQESATPQPGAVSEESLGRLLQSMGLKPTKDKQRYDFEFEAMHEEESWNLSMSAVLSSNGETIWVMAWLDALPRSANDVPRTALLRLLADNDRLGKGKFFAYIPANRRFVLQRVVVNRNMTSAGFRDVLQDLGGSVADTYSHWSVANWTSKSAETADSSDAQPNGPPIRNATRESNKFRDTTRN